MLQNPKRLVINNSENEKLSLVIIFSNRFIWRSKVSIPYFPHGKLYHLSYIPTILTLENPKCPVINNCENEKNISAYYVINKEILNRNKILITNSFFWRWRLSQSPYLSHAKWVLYHLSYIPTILAPQNPKFSVINNSEKWRNIATQHVMTKEKLKRNNIFNNW